MLILSNQSSNTLAGAGLDCGLLLLMVNLLDWTTGENIGVRSPDTVVRSMVRLRWSVREVVVKSSDRSGNIGKSLLLLSQVEWVERLKQIRDEYLHLTNKMFTWGSLGLTTLGL